MNCAKSRHGGRDDQRHVDIDDPQELHHWAQQFETTEADIKAAVAVVGSDVAKVGDYVQSGRKPHRHPSRHRPPRLRDGDIERGAT
jgi:hypothetical protein